MNSVINYLFLLGSRAGPLLIYDLLIGFTNHSFSIDSFQLD